MVPTSRGRLELFRLRRPVVVMLIGWLATVGPARGEVVYSSNFAAGAGAEWSPNRTEKAPAGSRTFLGRFGSETVRLSLPSLPAHTSVTLTCDVFAIGPWAGNDATNGPDVFRVGLDNGRTLLKTSFSNGSARQSYPERYPASDYAARAQALSGNNLGFSGLPDATYRLTFTFPHRDSDLNVQFSASGLNSASQQTWGIGAVKVTTYNTVAGSLTTDGDLDVPTAIAPYTVSSGSTFNGWTVDSGSVRFVPASTWTPASGVQCAEIGPVSTAGIRQDVLVKGGQQYVVRFALSGNPMDGPPVKKLQVLWNGTVVDTLSFDTTGNDATHMGWTWYRYPVTAPTGATSVTLLFQSMLDGPGGPLLDGISVTPVVPGDVDNDGVVSLADAAASLRMAHGLNGSDPLAIQRADIAPWTGQNGRIHGDGGLGFEDALLALRIASGDPLTLENANAAVNDLVGHFWTGTAISGHVLPTSSGTYNAGNPNGYMWERCQFLNVLQNLYLITGDATLKSRIVADWNWENKTYTVAQLSGAGGGSVSGWSDDAGWADLMYIKTYTITQDTRALEAAKGLFNNSYARWADSTFGGGLWYTDDRSIKSVYQVNLILAGLRLYDITGDTTFRDRAVALYQWVDTHLKRGNGLYYVDYDANGPRKNNAPPLEASSDTFLGGNMAMAVIAARLYRATNDPSYLNKALATASAIYQVEQSQDGVLLDDRDSQTNGFFVCDYVSEVLTLPGIGPEQADLIRRTAAAVYRRDRTPDGYYGGSWSGPAQGSESAWYRTGSFMPFHIMTASNAVANIVAAAGIGVLKPAPARP